MKSLGEMEGKRSYRRDTVVLALPELAQRGWERGMDEPYRSEAQRDAPMPFNPFDATAGQRYEDGRSDRLPALTDA